MPTSANNFPTELPKKKQLKSIKNVESKKSVPQVSDTKSTESTAAQGAGENPTKKATKVTSKIGSKGSRRVSSAATDGLPKKNVQKTKGSLSLSKTTEQTEGEQKAKRQPQVEFVQSLDPLVPQVTQSHAGTRGGEGRKSNVPVRIKARTKRAPQKEPKTPPKQKFAVPPVTEQPGGVATKEKASDTHEREPPVSKTEEVHAVAPGINSCSFFERLQQGVKAYFGSRGSFTPGERNRKEGGIRTRARVEKGVKEDAKKRKPGLIVKNKINNSERDSLNSSLGGQSSNFLSPKPKIFRNFRKLKRKKLYRPKKHCVRIQIPRKGYFYRSTVQFRSQESPSSALRRLERHIEPKTRSKAEISGLASTSSEVSDLPNEKTVKAKLQHEDEAEIPSSGGSEVEIPVRTPPEFLERLGRAANDVASSYSFRHMLDDYLVSKHPEVSGCGEKVSEMLFEIVNPEPKGKRQTSAISETPSPNFQRTKNSWRTSPRVGDEFSEILEFPNEKVFPTDDNKHNCGLQVPFKPFETLMHPLDTAFEDLACYMKTSSLTLIREESPEDERFSQGGPIRRSSALSDHPGNSQGEQTIRREGGPKSDGATVDLPFDLDDLLKDTDTFQSKTNGFCGSLKRCGRDSREEFYEVGENKSGSSFASAVSVCTPQHLASATNRLRLGYEEVEEHPRMILLKRFTSLTILTKKSHCNRKSKSENDLKKWIRGSRGKHGKAALQIFSIEFEKIRVSQAKKESHVEGPNDSYEKILPLGTRSKSRGGLQRLEFRETGTTFLNEKPKKRERWSPTLTELTEIYDSILKENKKFQQRDGNKPLTRCSSSYLMTFLKQKLKEKRLKMELVDFSKNFRDSFRPKSWKPGKVTDPSFGLTEYVAMFQEILHSNLTVSQIARLNDTLSGFHEYHDLAHSLLEESRRTDRTKQHKDIESQDDKNSEIDWINVPSKKDMPKIDVSPPKDLETILKSFNSDAAVSPNQDDKGDQHKFLVTVRLSGNHVLVNSVSYFKNEKHLKVEKDKEKGTSELIIENLTKRQMQRDVARKSARQKLPSFETKLKRWCRMGKLESSKRPLDSKKPKMKTCDDQKRGPPEQQTETETPRHIPEFHYDQFQMRAQHPIEAIVEGSEPKIDKNLENTEEKSRGKSEPHSQGKMEEEKPDTPTAIHNALQEALAGKIYLKDLFYELGHSEEEVGKIGREGPYGAVRPRETKWRPSSPKRKQANTVRSMFELKKSASGKTPVGPCPTYLCYPSVMNFQDKKNTRDKKFSPQSTAFKPKPTKNAPCLPNKSDPSKKPVKDPKKPKLETANTQTSDAETEQEPQPSAKQSTRNDQGPASNCCSIELLLSDVSRNALHEGKTHSQDKTNQTETGSRKPDPILLHCSKSDADGTSFRSEIIHSDSFLKYCTPLRVTQSKLKTLLKCNSDVKFYPGRVCENSEDQEPYITFMLTPRQKETAGLPANMVQVVQKKKTLDPAALALAFSDDEDLENTEEGSVEAIENFVVELVNLRKAAIERQKQKANEKKNSVKFDTGNKPRTPPKSPERRPPQERKAYHECQKRKASNSPAKPQRVVVTPPIGNLKQSKSGTGTNTEKSEQVLDNLVKKTCVVFSNLFKKRYLDMQRRENMKDKATEMNSSENKLKVVVTDIIQTESNTEKDDKDKFENVSLVPNDLLQAIKVAINQMEGFDSKEKIIAAIENVEKKRARKEPQCPPSTPVETEPLETVEVASCKLPCPPNTPKKPRTLRIKIRCKGHKCMEKCVSPPMENSKPEGDAPQPQSPAGEIALLDSLVSKEGGEALGRKNSTYFDALEGEEGAGEKMPTSQPVEAVADSSCMKQESLHPSLTPSDERLLSTVSFEKETEEAIYKKISKYLEDGEISYSVSLLERFLKKTENTLDDVESRARLNDLLSLIENKSRNLMVNMERNAWLKVLSLLDEASHVLESDSVKQSKKAQLVEKIQALNIGKLADLKFCVSSQTVRVDNSPSGNFIGILRESLSFFRRKVTRKRSRTHSDWADEVASSESAIRIHSAEGFPEMRQWYADREEPRTKLRSGMGPLMSPKEALVTPKIGDLKSIVMMKMKSLENAIERYNYLGESSKECQWGKGSPPLVNICRKREGRKPPRENLSRRPGYVDLIRYFMKAWDARMSLSSLSNCRS